MSRSPGAGRRQGRPPHRWGGAHLEQTDCDSVHAEARRDAEIAPAASRGDQVATAPDGRPYVDGARKRAVGAGSGRDGMGHEGMPDEGRRDQIDEIAGPAACSAHRHCAATRDACRVDAEPRSRCGAGPAENEGNARRGNRADEQPPASSGHGHDTSEADPSAPLTGRRGVVNRTPIGGRRPLASLSARRQPERRASLISM